jgi:hypothetical protein
MDIHEDIHDYKKRLARVEQKLRNCSLSDKKKSCSTLSASFFLREISSARIETYLSILRLTCEKLKKMNLIWNHS